jgi:chorismate-pyruvate lyase
VATPPVDLSRMLRESAGTVTDLLETATGEPLRAEVLRQEPADATVDRGLGEALGEMTDQSLCHRVAVLRGTRSRLPYLYAESVFVVERLPASARQQLECTDDPIGRVLVAHRLRLSTEGLAAPAPPYPVPARTAAEGRDIVWARAYRLLVDGAPIFAIREWFFRPVLDALARPAVGRLSPPPARRRPSH